MRSTCVQTMRLTFENRIDRSARTLPIERQHTVDKYLNGGIMRTRSNSYQQPYLIGTCVYGDDTMWCIDTLPGNVSMMWCDIICCNDVVVAALHLALPTLQIESYEVTVQSNNLTLGIEYHYSRQEEGNVDTGFKYSPIQSHARNHTKDETAGREGKEFWSSLFSLSGHVR